jgi:hypothetical protein
MPSLLSRLSAPGVELVSAPTDGIEGGRRKFGTPLLVRTPLKNSLPGPFEEEDEEPGAPRSSWKAKFRGDVEGAAAASVDGGGLFSF